jgi:hypothetical protein
MAAITDISQLDFGQTYSYADYLSWRFKEYVELIKGRVLRKMSAPTSERQQIATNLTIEIGRYLKRRACRIYAAPFDVRLLRSTGNGDAQIKTVVQPDISVIGDLSKIDKRGCLGAPDWIIEIVAPSSPVLDTRTKLTSTPKMSCASTGLSFPASKPLRRMPSRLRGNTSPPAPMPSRGRCGPACCPSGLSSGLISLRK